MSKLPYTRIYVGLIYTVAISGAHIQVLDTSTGRILHSTASSNTELKTLVLKSGPIRCSVVDDAFKYIATTTDEKVLRIWEIEGLKILNERIVAKRPTDIKFTKNGKTILVSDKFGDVFTFGLHSSSSSTEGPPATSEGSGSDKPSTSGSLLMGHASLLTTFLLTPDQKFIITADRDEHIRVSWYPEAYVIEEYCLGHEKFVSALHIPPWDTTQLISGGGDPMLKFWDWETGSLSYELNIAHVMMPFVNVKRPKGKGRMEDGDEDGDVEGSEKRVSARQKRKAKKGKGKGKEQETLVDVDMGGSEHNDKNIIIEEEGSTMADGDVILAIQKIRTMTCGTDRLLLLTAVGCSALFYCTYPDASTASTTELRYLDFGKPILDFVYVSENEIYVVIDAEWNMVDTSQQASDMVHCAIYTNNMFAENSESSKKALFSMLNGEALLPATTPADIQALDLYSSLTIYPKMIHRGLDPAERIESDEIEIPGEEKEPAPDSPGSKKPKLSRKQGRLKRKQALLAKIQSTAGSTALHNQNVEKEPDAKKLKEEVQEDDNEDDTKMDL